MGKPGKNTIILSILFFGPLLFYLFLLTGTNNFARLPVLTQDVMEIEGFSTEQEVNLGDHITILGFLGSQPLQHKTNALNLNEKIYKHFDGFSGFQFVIVLPIGAEEEASLLKKELGTTYNVDKWHFVFGEETQVRDLFNSLKTTYALDEQLYTPYAFIIDRDRGLRGRDEDDEVEGGIRYGYNAESVATVHQEMVDDVKVLVAEYRMALKKNKRKI